MEMMADHMLVCEKHPYPEAHRRAESAELRATEAEAEAALYRTQWKDTEKLLRVVERQRDEWQRKFEEADTRHVRFMVQGGPVVMATEFDAMKVSSESRVAALQAQLETARRDTMEECCKKLCDCCDLDGPPSDFINRPNPSRDGGPRWVHEYDDGGTIECSAAVIRAALSQLPTPAQDL
jgi:hypothetical protein